MGGARTADPARAGFDGAMRDRKIPCRAPRVDRAI